MIPIKRHFPAALLLLILAGCAIDEPYQATRTEEKQITIKAIREDDDTPETRTVRNEKGKVYWSKGDQISLFYGHGTNGGSVFTSTQEADTVKVTNFVGTITAITGGGDITIEDTYFWGLYPYNETASCDGSSIITSLPSFQVAYPGSYANGTNISVGRSQGLIMGFYNACGGFRFSLNKEGVKKVTFKGKNGEDLVGKLKISFVNGKVSTEILEGENEVVLEAPAGKYFEPGVLYYFVLAPTVLSSGFTVKAETYTEETTFSYDSSVTIEASNFKSKKQMDTGLTWTKKTGNIPIEDANFKAYLVSNFDGNGDGEISYEEADHINIISAKNNSFISLQGIEYMERLEKLDVGYGRITSIDLSNNPLLTDLQCNSNRLTKIDVSKNTALTNLSCEVNQLTSLDISNNTALTQLNCSANGLSSLDVSKNTALTFLACSYNSLSSIDVSKNTALTELHCSYSGLENLDVSKNTVLTKLDCSNNSLSFLYVVKNTELASLNCSSNHLSFLDVSKNTALTKLVCNSNSLHDLDVTKNTGLTWLNCSSDWLTSLDVSKNTALSRLECSGNQISSLDVSNNHGLTYFDCASNKLISLDLSNNLSLNSLDCCFNLLASLDVSNNLELSSLDCSPMKDSNGSNLLETLYISQGQDIPLITTDRSDLYIPAETRIEVISYTGGDASFVNEYLTFEILSDGVIGWKISNSEVIEKTIEYSVNGNNWEEITSTIEGAVILVSSGDKVYFRGRNSHYATSFQYYNCFSSNCAFSVSGNIMSLIDSDTFRTSYTLPESNAFIGLFADCSNMVSAEDLSLPSMTLTNNCYEHLFSDCISLIKGPSLPATTLANSCYSGMFKNCKSLKSAPELPATSVKDQSYSSMFRGCSSLISAPNLPAMVLGTMCYYDMFDGCSSLSTAPALPATVLESYCYASMFSGCTSLTTPPSLPAETLASHCYQYMFDSCTSLLSAPELTATFLAPYCYEGMFTSCTSLTAAPSLPAISLENYCYANMFSHCSSLITAPELPALQLKLGCYMSMFSDCASLTTAPVLSAGNLVEKCYYTMFYNCRELNYIECLAQDISASNCTFQWVWGTSSLGTFVKASSMTSWTNGLNGIPTGWTIKGE